MVASTSFVFLSLCLLGVALGGQFIQYSYGGRNNMLFIPSASGSRPLPVFVMLHGCTQNPTDFATGTKMNTYADQYNFFVVYPEQTTAANANKCWNWFEPAHQSRGSGEPALIVSIAQSLSHKYQIDNTRFFVGGLSAGAAMSDILGVTYPDVFRGVTVGAGLEYKAATSVTGAFTAMSSGGPNPTTQGQVAYKAMGSYARTLLVLVVHGTSDYTVAIVNGQQVVTSYATNLDYVLGNGTARGDLTSTPTTTTPGQVPGGRAYTTNTYASKRTGETFIQYITVTGMAHAWSGGNSAGTYTDPKGPDASLLMVNFFLTNNSTSGSPTATTATTTTTTTTTTATTTGTSTTTSTSTTTTTTTGGSTTGGKGFVFTSIAQEDGFVGMTPQLGFSTTVCQVGAAPYIMDSYRTILSFDTSDLSSLNVSSAILTIKRQSLKGTIAPLIVDIKAGSFGGSSLQLAQLSYFGLPSASAIGYLDIPSSDNDSISFSIPAQYLEYVTGGAVVGSAVRTQIKLRENTFPPNPTAAPNILQIYDGEATLTVTVS